MLPHSKPSVDVLGLSSMMEYNVHTSAMRADQVICPNRVLQEVREVAVAKAQMKGYPMFIQLE